MENANGLSGTILESVMTVLSTGQFASDQIHPIEDGEKVIGELSEFEKALFTAKSVFIDEHNAWAQTLMETIEKGGVVDADSAAKDKIDNEIVNSLGYLLWASIHSRLGAKAYEGGNLALRDKYQVVLIPRRESFSDFIKKMVIEDIFGLKPHDCQTCSIYESCDLDIKEPR